MSLTRFQQTQQSVLRLFVVVLIVGFVGGCGSSRSVENRIIHADSLVHTSKLQPLQLKTPYFFLYSAYHFPKPAGLLTVYIEGDGRSWVSRYQLSSDPTPINPVALKLAKIDSEQDPLNNIAWIARPCQYQPNKGDAKCDKKYWSSHRFSKEVIDSVDNGIDQLLEKSGATQVRLVGFSGGAAVAALVAARRDDIESLVSIAGNLDHQQVNEYHGVTPLRGSLNPKKVVKKIAKIPQMHFVGLNDEVIPQAVADDFIKAQKNNCAQKVVVPSAGHIDGWVGYWPLAANQLEANLACSKSALSISF